MKDAHTMVAEAKSKINEVDVESAEQAIQTADVIIDVREPLEFQAGHIPAAINIPRGLLEFQLTMNPNLEARDKNIVLYCKSSGRAALAAQTMQEMGYLNVTSISGGFDAWSAAGKASVKPEEPDYD